MDCEQITTGLFWPNLDTGKLQGIYRVSIFSEFSLPKERTPP